MNKDLVKMQELKTEWKKICKKAFTEKTEKQMEDFCNLVKDTYDLKD